MGSEIPDIQISEVPTDKEEKQQQQNEEQSNEVPENSFTEDKTIHIHLKSFLSEEDSKTLKIDITNVMLPKELTGKQIKKHMYSLFGIKREYVIKLRNQNKSVLPFSNTIKENSHDNSYTLEVFYQYQTVTPLPRTVSVATYEQVLRRKLNNTNNRMSKLEDFIPELPKKQEIKINEEIKDLNDKMNILERKLTDADSTQWQGMFQRVPLW